jgi:hypothetical protein
MLDHNLPLNRETYIALNWGKTPREWTAEHEEEPPEPFRTDPFHSDKPAGRSGH